MLPVIISTSDYFLTDQEEALLKENKVYGFILMGRNIRNAEQLKRYIQSIKDLYADFNHKPLFFIDLECGGLDVERAARLASTLPDSLLSKKQVEDICKASYRGVNRLFSIDLNRVVDSVKAGELISKDSLIDVLNTQVQYSFKTAADIGNIFDRGENAAVRTEFYKMANALKSLGIDVALAPCVDLRHGGVDNMLVQNERLFSDNPEAVVKIANIATEVFADEGILTVAKHIPGHGVVETDSHYKLPIHDVHLGQDEQIFKQVQNCKYALIPHIVYKNISEIVATLSPEVVAYLRNNVMDVKYITDAIEMNALKEYHQASDNNNYDTHYLYDVTKAALEAGIDYVLYAGGQLSDNVAVCSAAMNLVSI
ncbi:glycoside hydrolase family 3 protein [Anaplasmataceae bacterium AB001_6]|nr:glycoside hydrolase family 3 protein [Anaplasmataceae bacterium AB001_6]